MVVELEAKPESLDPTVNPSGEEPITPTTEGKGQDAKGVPEDAAVSKPDATAGGDEDFKPEDLDEWKEAVKPEALEAKPIPGKAIEDAVRDEAASRARTYAQLVSSVRGQGAQATLSWLQEDDADRGFTPGQANLVLGIIQRYVDNLHGNNEQYNSAYFNAEIDHLLPPEVAKRVKSRQYTSKGETVGGAYALGGEDKEAEWLAKVEKGEYLPAAAVKKISKASFIAGRNKKADDEKVGNSTDRGEGVPSNSADRTNDDAKLLNPLTPQSEIDAIMARRAGG